VVDKKIGEVEKGGGGTLDGVIGEACGGLEVPRKG